MRSGEKARRGVNQIFLLSPARCDGRRAKILLSPSAEFALARRLSGEGAPLGEVFSFLSGLYFRGKLAYARAFSRPVADAAGALVITTDRGLVPSDVLVTHEDLRAFAAVDIGAGDPRYTAPLRRDIERLDRTLGASGRVILLGSIATGKYVDVLLEAFGERLVFPTDFVGRGDMSRGGLLLRCVNETRELAYEPVAGAVRHGKRPPKLSPLSRTNRSPTPGATSRRDGSS
jgi:hypothetical protein